MRIVNYDVFTYMNKRLARLIRVGFIIADLLMLNVGYMVGRIYLGNSISDRDEVYYAYLIFYLNLAWTASAWMTGIYLEDSLAKFERFGKRSFRAFSYFLIMVILYLYFLRQVEISRLLVVLVLLVSGSGIVVCRALHLWIFQFLKDRDYLRRRILIIGHNETAFRLVKYLEEESVESDIIGFCDEPEGIYQLSHYPVIGPIHQTMRIGRDYAATDIYSTIAPEKKPELYSLMRDADQACIRFKFVPDLASFIQQPVHIDYLGTIPILNIRREPLDDVANRIRKRLYDVLISILVIVFVLSWLVPLLGLLIWLESGGSIFFIQKRSGINNKPFNCIKFRSMRVNNDADRRQATRNDPRFTRIGTFIRKTNIDELPQFFNVLMSDMSIVGPRPHMLQHTEDFSKLYNQYMVRQFLKPGITGWAQVNGYRGEIHSADDIRKRVEHDLWYMENWSHWLDIKIMLMTGYSMIRGQETAY